MGDFGTSNLLKYLLCVIWGAHRFRYSWRSDTLDASGAGIITSGCKSPDADAGIELGSSDTVINTLNN